jgi:hypothetical protein
MMTVLAKMMKVALGDMVLPRLVGSIAVMGSDRMKVAGIAIVEIVMVMIIMTIITISFEVS